MLRFNFSALKGKNTDKTGFWVDIIMMLLIVLNLLFIIFDWHFEFAFFQNFLARMSPAFFTYYRDQVHPNFLIYDLFFVSIYVAELITSWMLAVKHKTYERWYVYPLIHWYDVLGCIPVGTFRWLRILRIFSILFRLHKTGVVNLKETYLFQKSYLLYKIIMEEISDRVVLRLLDGVEDEIRLDNPVSKSVASHILEPHKEEIARWVSHRLKSIAEHNYNIHINDLKKHIETSIGTAIRENKEIKKIRAIPYFGKKMAVSLEGAVAGVVAESVNRLLKGFTTDQSEKTVTETIESVFDAVGEKEPDRELSDIIKSIAISAVELVKNQVRVKKWKENGKVITA